MLADRAYETKLAARYRAHGHLRSN